MHTDLWSTHIQVYHRAVELMPTGRTFRVAPSHINVYYNLANLVKMDPARLEEAYSLYQKALSMKPDFVEAHMNKGDVLLKMNRTLEAKLAFEKALEHNPGYADAHYNLGTTHVQLGDKRGAENCYRRALAIQEDHLYSSFSLALLLQEVYGREGREEAKGL